MKTPHLQLSSTRWKRLFPGLLLVFLLATDSAASADSSQTADGRQPTIEIRAEDETRPEGQAISGDKAPGKDQPGSDDWQRRLEMLRSVPYVDVSCREIDTGDTGVVIYDPDRLWAGCNFYCPRRKGSAFLLDMEGRTLHRWTYHPTVDDHAIMLENGDLVIVIKHFAVVRIDWTSKEIWRKRLAAHHDIAQAGDGSFFTIVRELKGHRGLQIWFDDLVRLSEDGEEIDRWSSYDHLAELKLKLDPRSFLDTVLDSVLARGQAGKDSLGLMEKTARQYDSLDYFHINSVSVLPENPMGLEDRRFAPGNLLVCFRNVNQIVILSPETHQVLWAWGEERLEWPHHPTMLDNGHILLFDNGIRRGFSRVLQIDPVGGEVVWEYSAAPDGRFYSGFRGSAQRLPNGNTLICESDEGRVFEVTPAGEIVWTWLNPDIRGHHRRSLYRWSRLSESQVSGLLLDGER